MMKAEELDAIRERWREGKEELTEPTNVYLHDDDVPKLLDEVEKWQGLAEDSLKNWERFAQESKELRRLYNLRSEECDGVREELAEWKENSEGWHKAYKGLKQDLEQVQGERERLQKENERLREALGFYADKKTYQLGVRFSMGTAHPSHEPIEYDKGEKARKALEGLE